METSPAAKMPVMDLKDFKKYIRGKSIDKLLHQARKQSLSRIESNEKELSTGRRTRSVKRAAGTSR